MLDEANKGPTPHPALLRAILHGVAAGACRVAAREDEARGAYWDARADDQSKKSRARLHQAARCDGSECAVARTSRVTSAPLI